MKAAKGWIKAIALVCGLVLLLSSNAVSADSVMDAGRQFGVYNSPNSYIIYPAAF